MSWLFGRIARSGKPAMASRPSVLGSSDEKSILLETKAFASPHFPCHSFSNLPTTISAHARSRSLSLPALQLPSLDFDVDAILSASVATKHHSNESDIVTDKVSDYIHENCSSEMCLSYFDNSKCDQYSSFNPPASPSEPPPMSAYLAATSSVQIGDVRGDIVDWRFTDHSKFTIPNVPETVNNSPEGSVWGDADTDIASDACSFTLDEVKPRSVIERPWIHTNSENGKKKQNSREFLCAVDLDDDSSAYAFRWMAKEQLRDGDRVHIVNVTDTKARRRFSAPPNLIGSHALEASRQQEAETIASRLAIFIRENWPANHIADSCGNQSQEEETSTSQSTFGPNIHMIIHVLHGNPKEVILRAVEDLLPSLVVLGSGQDDKCCGPVAAGVVRKSLCPVVIARDPTRDAERFAKSRCVHAAGVIPLDVKV